MAGEKWALGKKSPEFGKSGKKIGEFPGGDFGRFGLGGRIPEPRWVWGQIGGARLGGLEKWEKNAKKGPKFRAFLGVKKGQISE